MRASIITCSLAALGFAVAAVAQDGRGYYRYPTLYGNDIVFAAEGDLWTVVASGGVARRLTTHPGEESHPAASPDGRLLAFTASYEGPSEIYVMPLSGGVPERLTFDGDESTTLGWTAAGEILYTTNHYSTLPSLQLVKLDPTSRERTRVPLSEASEASYDDTGRTLFFVRPAFHRNVTKRYRGGTARKIWRYDERAPEAVPLTADYAGESHTPMAWGGRVYFVTDRDGTMNLWSMNEEGRDPVQHTFHSGLDVRDPSLADGRIVYQVGADLWLYDVASRAASLVPIELPSDFDQLRDKWITEPWEHLDALHLHPRGDSVALTVRGRVFVAPAKQGRLVRASREEGVRYRDAVFLGGGERLVGLSDAGGEVELVTLPSNGVGEVATLTSDGATTRLAVFPSPDGTRVAYRDTEDDLWLLDVASRNRRLVSTNREGVEGISWSPDSRFLAYSQTAPNTFLQIHLFEVATGQRIAVTSDRVNSTSATFSPDGRFLYFLSDRDLRSVVQGPWGPRQPEPYFDAPIKVYELALQPGIRSPFRPADELFVEPKADEDENDEDDDDADDGAAVTTVDARDIERRIREVPAGSGNYRALDANDKALFWLARGPGRDDKWRLQALPIERDNPKVTTLLEGVEYYELSDDGKKLLIRKEKKLYVVDAAAKPLEKVEEAEVPLAGFSFSLDVEEDWRQIFLDAWRLERDYFYDPGMHGVDWVAARDKYLPLVARVTTRDELSDVIGQLVGELSALHTAVRGGDLRDGPDDVVVASLGARFSRAREGYRIEHIYRSDPDYPSEASPLADPALGIAVGDVIESVNGVSTLSAPDIGALLRNQADRQVLLRLRSPNARASREVVVTPIRNETSLRYGDWEYSRRLVVEEQGQGSIGYVHLRAMGGDDITAWYRQFYPVFDRQGLIIDVRRNRGGNIDSLILGKLLRRDWFFWQARTRAPSWNMQYAFRGHMVVLVDANTASDGEAFAEGFRRLELGPVIGTRTWGGEIWLNDSLTVLSDDGNVRVPQMGVYSPEGEWLIESHGVEPDIVVDNLPRATFDGGDAQLDAAIAYLRDAIARDPREVPAAPPFPNKSFDYPSQPTAPVSREDASSAVRTSLRGASAGR